jgi:transcriptional regulator with XRE-family HTH domain
VLFRSSKEVRSDDAPPTETLNLPALVSIRQRLIGVMLRQQREKASLSPRQLAERSGMTTARLRAYELGERPIPLPELESLLGLTGGRIEELFDQTGPVGRWQFKQRAIQDFLQLPPEVQEFVCKPVNRPYLDLAQKLSGMTTDRLRALAEDLLDITL